MKPRLWLTLCGLSFLAGCATLPWLAGHGSTYVRHSLPVALVVLAIPALVAVPLLARCRATRYDWILIFAVGLLARGLFLSETPYLSTDVYRYIWDGRVQEAGLSPYGRAPIHPELDHVEAQFPAAARVRQRVNHDHIPTIYPPLTQLMFRAGAWLDAAFANGHRSLERWRLCLLVCEVGIALLLMAMLRGVARDPRWVLLYLWHPLPVVETAWSAHAETLSVLLFLLVLWLCARRRLRLAAVCCGLAGAAKLLPFALVPYLWRRGGVRAVLLVACGAAATVLPFLGNSPAGVLAGLGAYAEGWYFNDILFRLLGAVLGIDVENRELFMTRFLRGALVFVFAALCVREAWRDRDAYRMGFVVAAGFVLFSPTLHPWYLLWLLPLAIVRAQRGWLLLTVTVLLSHIVSVHHAESGVWREHDWVRFLEFVPPLLLVLSDTLTAKRARREAEHSGQKEPGSAAP